jgi:hypothetical protein
MVQLVHPGRLMGAGRGGVPLPIPPFNYVINAKKSNTTKLRAGIFGTARTRNFILGDSIAEAKGTVAGESQTGFPGARFALSFAALLQPLINAAICPSDIDSVIGGHVFSSTAGAYQTYDPRVFAPTWALNASTSAAGKLHQHSTTGSLFQLTTSKNVDTLDAYILDPNTGLSIRAVTDGVTRAIWGQVGAGGSPLKKSVTVPSTPAVALAKNGGSGNIYFCAFEAYNAAYKGLSWMQGGWAGASTATWLDTTNAFSSAFMLPVIAPDHVFIQLGPNDMVGLTQLQYETNLQTLIDMVHGWGGEVTLVVSTPCSTTVIAQATQDAFRQSVLNVGATNDLSILDLPTALGTYAYLNSLGIITADGVHWNNYALIATIYRNYLLQVKALGA